MRTCVEDLKPTQDIELSAHSAQGTAVASISSKFGEPKKELKRRIARDPDQDLLEFCRTLVTAGRSWEDSVLLLAAATIESSCLVQRIRIECIGQAMDTKLFTVVA